LSSDQSVGAGMSPVPSCPSLKQRCCRLCGDVIPQIRLDATKGRATECVTCLTLLGDVPTIKRFDEAGQDGIVETVFYRNSYVEKQMNRVNHVAAPNLAYEEAVGDDSHLQRDDSQPVAQAFSPSEAFEEDPEERAEPIASTETHIELPGYIPPVAPFSEMVTPLTLA
jgi:hypothetical protein